MRHRFYLGALTALFISSAALVADRLSGPEVKDLLTGSRIEAYTEGKSAGVSSIALEQSARRQEDLIFAPDGTVERNKAGKMKTHTETGEWWVNKKGKLCMKWSGSGKKQCSYLVPTGKGAYELHGKKGKRNLVFDKVMKK